MCIRDRYIAQQIGITEDKLVSNIQRYGNTTAATIPILLAEAEQSGRLKRGMKVAMVAFGSGFTWGAAIVDCCLLYTSPSPRDRTRSRMPSSA